MYSQPEQPSNEPNEKVSYRSFEVRGPTERTELTLFLAESDSFLLSLKLHRGSLHVICARGPAHERVDPSARTSESVEVEAIVIETGFP